MRTIWRKVYRPIWIIYKKIVSSCLGIFHILDKVLRNLDRCQRISQDLGNGTHLESHFSQHEQRGGILPPKEEPSYFVSCVQS
jgi:hypothetical protein